MCMQQIGSNFRPVAARNAVHSSAQIGKNRTKRRLCLFNSIFSTAQVRYNECPSLLWKNVPNRGRDLFQARPQNLHGHNEILQSSTLKYSVLLQVVTNVSEEPAAFIVRAKGSSETSVRTRVRATRTRVRVRPSSTRTVSTHRNSRSHPRGVTIQKATIGIFTSVKISNFIYDIWLILASLRMLFKPNGR